MRRLLPVIVVLAVVLAVAGCGGSSDAGYERHDLGSGWTVLWKPDGSEARVRKDGDDVAAGGVRVRPLGPEPGERVGPTAQVAAEVSAPQGVDDAALLVDGEPLPAASGGLSAKRVTVYGTRSSLSSGRHVVVAVAVAGDSGSARAWTFTVR